MPRFASLLRPGAVAAAAVVAGLVASRSNYSAFIATLALSWGLVGIGLAVLSGWGNQISLAQGAFFGVGAYMAVIGNRLGLPFLMAPLLGIAAGIVLGLLAGLPSLRLRGSFLAVATIAVQYIIQNTFFRWDYVDTRGTGGVVDRPEMFASDRAYFWLAAIITGAGGVLVYRLRQSQSGRLLRALRGSGLDIQSSGHSLAMYRLLAGVVSTVLTVLGGVIFAGLVTRISYESFGLKQSIVFLTGAVVGGLGSLWGAFSGVVLASLLPEILRATPVEPGDSNFVLGGLSLAVLLVNPGGLAAIVIAARARLGGFRRPGMRGVAAADEGQATTTMTRPQTAGVPERVR